MSAARKYTKEQIEKIQELRILGWKYTDIAKEVNCSYTMTCYYGDERYRKASKKSRDKYREENQEHIKQKNKEWSQNNKDRTRKWKKSQHPFYSKLSGFKSRVFKQIKDKTGTYQGWKRTIKTKITTFFTSGKKYKVRTKPTFKVQDIIDKFGENPRCYITGDNIDIKDTASYHFDHIVPKSKGGENTIDNLGICTKEANQAKHNLELKEYLELCRRSLENHGYEVR